MTGKIARPRSALSILFITIALGPFFAMLWIGRWRWALAYLVLAVAAALGISALEDAGILPPEPLFAIFTPADAVSLTAQALIGAVHALALRRTSLARPWYRWIAAVPALLYVAAVAVFLPVRTFIVQPFWIPSTSDVPALYEGDYVLVSKSAYGYSRYSFPLGLASFDGRLMGAAPERGDMAVFRHPRQGGIDYVKRVIGLPGERIRVAGGVLSINGVPVPRERVDVAPEYAALLAARYWRETLPNGRSYVIADTEEDGPGDDTPEFTVPEGEYFMMGDNRDNSVDSRYPELGTVPLTNFIGPVRGVLFNGGGRPAANRPQ